MKRNLLTGHPILSCADAGELEKNLFAGDEAKEWVAMQQAGEAIAAAMLEDFCEIAAFPSQARLLVLAGKGHNGGDALIAAREVLCRFPGATAEILFVFGSRELRPLARRAYEELAHFVGARVTTLKAFDDGRAYDLCFDGIFGFQFHPPAKAPVPALLKRVNASRIRFRAAVDLPSASLFRADFTYATGSLKEPVLETEIAGRVRYLDLGFFSGDEKGAQRVVTDAVLDPLRQLRSPSSDKRSQGHLFLVGGSRQYPGAILMATLAAVRSGAGLVTAFVPESLVASFAARVPEAMWCGWPETPEGGLALEGRHLLQERLKRASAIAIGPGLGREPETLTLLADIVGATKIPLLLDADALQPEIVRAAKGPLVITPHAGEFKRVAGKHGLEEFTAQSGVTVVLKGPMTRVAHRAGSKHSVRDVTVYHSPFGGPVLSRGGSGDMLAGLTGGLLAQTPDDSLNAALRGVVWHGRAADEWARACGQAATHSTQLLDFLAPALRNQTGFGDR